MGMQTAYILWTWLIEGRPRATISALFMFTFRGILGYSTQLPLPQVHFQPHFMSSSTFFTPMPFIASFESSWNQYFGLVAKKRKFSDLTSSTFLGYY